MLFRSMAEDAEGAAGAAGSAPGAGAGEEEEDDMAAARRGRRCRARWWEERRGDLAAAREAAQREERERARLPPMAGVKYGTGRRRGREERWPSGDAGAVGGVRWVVAQIARRSRRVLHTSFGLRDGRFRTEQRRNGPTVRFFQ